VARNVDVGRGEIDIVAEDRRLVLVEVRTLTGSIYPLDAIDDGKRRQLRSLAVRAGLGRIDLIGVGLGHDHVVFHWDPDSV